MKDDKIMSG